MERSIIHQRFHPKLQTPIFVEGLPGFGNVGKITAQLLTHFSDAKLFAEYYSPFFPDYVVVSDNGICSPPRYEFYVSPSDVRDAQRQKLSVIVLTGDSQPPLGNVVAHYIICEEILDFVQTLGCRLLITVGGVPAQSEKKDVFVAATSTELAAEVMKKGGLIYGKGRILGATGLLLGLAKKKGLDGICLLGATSGLQSDKDAGDAVFKLLLKFLGQKTNFRLEEKRKS